MSKLDNKQTSVVDRGASASEKTRPPKKPTPKETGGPKGPEPTRYGDWERKGIASDF